ncbi:hypothetical protein EVJ58_g5686 [Rhodofomes roseus]|uniref:Molecular chaperone DnaK (HSP70) n=1 Tax=Rhodofomes roseus TaxID=34475 RepID=A0A4Y9YFC7_9APHY|nr:hypothetical protein EVJ58_g5686 [Rhodofomes roseus]
MPRGEPYLGTTPKLVLSIDVGTTYSGASFCVLEPREVPKVFSVTRFPGQEGENKARDTKIPSVLYYDNDGELRAVGAEALSDATGFEAEAENWTRVDWFKLRLRPGSKGGKGEQLPKILIDKPVVQIFADYLAYLFKCATDFISETHLLGREVLESGVDIEFVLSHPNGWGGQQQAKMRRAATLAGLIPDTEAGHAQLHFVSEGEASLHFCIVNGLAGNVIQAGNHVMIVDAGGGTVDVSTYQIMKACPWGTEKLQGSRFETAEFVDKMLYYFETNTKPTFKDPSKTAYIKFGGNRDTDVKRGIARGAVSLTGVEVAELFRPSVNAIVSSIQDQRDRTNICISLILLVGGFASSPFLRSTLQGFARAEGLALFCPEMQTSKAVAEGALWFHLDHFVSARIARYAYGTSVRTLFDVSQPDHMERKAKAILGADGTAMLRGVFSEIIPRGRLVEVEEEFYIPVTIKCHQRSPRIHSRIVTYRGLREIHRWIDEEPDSFSTLCTVHADVNPESYKLASGQLGEFYRMDFNVVLLFGLTEIKAQLSWLEDGREKRGPATLVYDDEDEAINGDENYDGSTRSS